MTCSMPREVPAMRNIFWQTLKKNSLLLVVLIAAIIASIAVSVTPPSSCNTSSTAWSAARSAPIPC